MSDKTIQISEFLKSDEGYLIIGCVIAFIYCIIYTIYVVQSWKNKDIHSFEIFTSYLGGIMVSIFFGPVLLMIAIMVILFLIIPYLIFHTIRKRTQ